jgi:hypothetical protein
MRHFFYFRASVGASFEGSTPMSDLKLPFHLSPGKAGKAAGWSRTKIMDLVRDGRLEAVVDNKRIRIVGRSLEKLLTSLPTYRPGQMPDLHPRNPLPTKKRRKKRPE